MAFEATFNEAVLLLQQARGYRSHDLKVSAEDVSDYLLIVDWQTLEDHTKHFRASADHVEWKALLDPFYSSKPASMHFISVCESLSLR